MQQKSSKNIADFLTKQAQLRPHQIAVYEPTGKSKRSLSYAPYTYETFEREVNCVAAGLVEYGLSSGMRVALMVKPSFDFLVLAFALLRIKVVPVFVDPGLGIKNLKQCLGEAELDGFIGIPFAHIARKMFGWSRGRDLKLIWVGPRPVLFGKSLAFIRESGLNKGLNPIYTDPDDLAAIVYTSGSTGAPKGVLYSHENFYCQVELQRQAFGIGENEIDLCTFPLFALFAPGLGMTSVIPRMNFTKPGYVDANCIIDPIKQFGVTQLFGSPALLAKVLADLGNREVKLPSLRRVVTAGAPLQPRTIAGFQRLLSESAEILTPYGATECLPISVISSREILGDTAQLTSAGRGVCVGRPVAGLDVRIIPNVDEEIPTWSERLSLKPGEIGEIVVRGPQVSRSYLNRPAATWLGKILVDDTRRHSERSEESRVGSFGKPQEDGSFFHRMGDLGYFDERGRLWFCGRKVHQVAGRERVWYSVPIEGVFNQHPKVARTALIGLQDSEKRVPALCVELFDKKASRRQMQEICNELRRMARENELTHDIEKFYFNRSFPVDIRHNSKIFREKLAVWAGARKPMLGSCDVDARH